MTLHEYRRGPVPTQVKGYADIRVVSSCIGMNHVS